MILGKQTSATTRRAMRASTLKVHQNNGQRGLERLTARKIKKRESSKTQKEEFPGETQNTIITENDENGENQRS